MPNTYNSTTESSIYRDDWDEAEGYHKILFNSGRSLQARELTQLQTIIQQEITRFGRNIFKEGSAVRAGLMEVDNNYKYVRVTGTGAETIAVGTNLVGDTSGVSAVVLETVEIASNDARLYIRYTGTGGAAPGATETRFTLGEGINSGVYTVGSNSTDIGAGVRVIVDSGDFFAAGRFVYAPKQSLIVSPTSRVFNGTVGFVVTQDVITVNDTTDLYDNSGETPNVAAPGADRYRIRLVLTDKANATGTDSFIFLCRIINSTIVEQINELDEYNTINDMMARRTYEESGNYLAEPFQLTFEDDDSTDSDIFAVISPGLAYVRGYRVENENPLKLKLPRPQQYEELEADYIPVDYGTYVYVDASSADLSRYADAGGSDRVNLYTSTGGTGGPIGTAYIKGLTYETSGVYRVHLDNIEMVDVNSDFSSVASIGTSTSDYFDLTTVGELKESNNQTGLYALPRVRPRLISNYQFRYWKQYTVQNGGSISGDISSPDEEYRDKAQWLVVSKTTNAIVTNAVITIGATPDNFSISGLGAGDHYVVAVVERNNAQRKTKTLSTKTYTATIVGGVAELQDPDVLEVTSILKGTADITREFTLDNGQRDTHYEIASLKLKDAGAYTGAIDVTYKYWSWGNVEVGGAGTGLFFDAGSYGNVDYTEIPDHVQSDGTIVSLRDYVDFRGLKTGSNRIEAVHPVQGSSIQVTASYYLSRADKLIATEDGQFQILLGQQSRDPQFKKTPDNALELYKIVMNPNTVSPEDINTTFIEHKRYTMADIAKLERKLDALEESYTLSLAELEAKMAAQRTDNTGTPVPETGRQVDDFTDHSGSFVNHDDYCASLDPENKLLRACVSDDNYRLIYRPDDGVTDAGLPTYKHSSKNVLLKGDNIYIDHTETQWIDQPLFTQSVSINANSKTDYVGDLELSPSSDEWKSEQTGTRTTPGGGRIEVKEALLYNSHQWNWHGRRIEDFEVNPNELTRYGRAGVVKKPRNVSQRHPRRAVSSGGHVNRVISNETIRTVNSAGRTVDAAIVPWIRSRKIYFRATGLKPNTRFVPFFDGVDVSNWCNDEAFSRYASNSNDIGNQGQSSTSGHPDGSATLTSSASGKIEGSFFIPNVRGTSTVPLRANGIPRTLVAQNDTSLRFKCGKKEFKLMDVSTPDINQAGSYAVAIYDTSGMVENRKDGITSPRMPKKARLVESKIKRPYNASEMKDYLNGIGVGDVALIQPAISGGWGGDFPGNINLSGIDLSSVISDYVDVNQMSYAGTSSSPDDDVSYPFAQSFTVDNQFGVVLTKVDLFFETKDTSIPVTVEIRNMVNGKPGNSVVPGSTVTLEPGSVNENASGLESTTFTFEEPVFLDPGKEYALVVKTQSSNYRIFIAKTGEFKLNSTDVVVSSQAANGQLFLPHSGSAKASKELDLAFTLYRAVFETNASLVLRNVTLPYNLLQKDPIVLNGTTTVKVKHDCHGLSAGESVTISGVEAGSFGNGITEANLNATHTVVDVDAKHFTFTLGSAPTTTGNVGGSNVLSSRNRQFTTAMANIDSIVPNKCSIDVSARFTSGKSLGGSETKFVKDQNYSRIVPGTNVEFDFPKLIADRSVEISEPSISGNSGFSLDVKVDLKSANNYVSPVIDLQRCSMTLIQNCIDNGYYIDEVVETEPYGSSATSQHQTAPLETVEPSTILEAKIDANVPNVANLDFYYRAVMTGQNILDQNWIKVEPGAAGLPSGATVNIKKDIIKEENPQITHPIEFEVTGLPKFSMSQIKAVMKSTNLAKVPQITGINVGTFL